MAHREQNLAVVLGLLTLRLLEEHDIFYLGDTIDDNGYTVPEDHSYLVEGDVGILHYIMQQS